VSKNKKDDGRLTVDDGQEEEIIVEETLPAIPQPVVEEPKQYFEVVKWRGIKDVFRCQECGANRDDFDNIVLHILLHHAGREEEVFEILMKEKPL